MRYCWSACTQMFCIRPMLGNLFRKAEPTAVGDQGGRLVEAGTPRAAALSRSIVRLSCEPGPRPVMRTCDSTGPLAAMPISSAVAASAWCRRAVLQAEVEARSVAQRRNRRWHQGEHLRVVNAHQLLGKSREGNRAGRSARLCARRNP